MSVKRGVAAMVEVKMILMRHEVEQIRGWIHGPCSYQARRFRRAASEVVEEVESRISACLTRRGQRPSSLERYATQYAWKEALRVCLVLAKRAKREQHRDDFSACEPRARKGDNLLERIVDTEEKEREKERLKTAIAALPPRQLSALLTVQEAGHKNQQVCQLARRRGCSPQAIYQLAKRVLHRIRRELDEREE